MNFFESEARAHSRSGLLVFLFVLALAAILAAVNALVFLILLKSGYHPSGSWQNLFIQAAHGEGPIFHTSIAVILLVGFSALFKIGSLKSGGQSVAEMMGGRRVSPDTKDLGERRLMNVVEEMSLASGIGVPPVYVFPDRGINAFAAGYSPSSAVVAVSSGALAVLTRDELQGVVAHEFSHIFNGDMKLNIRLIGLLGGIVALAVVGRFVMQGGGGRVRSEGDKGGVPLALLLGLGLFLIGYIGVFFAQLIKSAISRQREFLADASAVQFTRNPAGILGALLKIRDGAGSRLASSSTEEVSHLLFAEGVSSVFATHPPLEDRIRAIDPSRQLEPRVKEDSARMEEEEGPMEAAVSFSGSAARAPARPAAAPAPSVSRVTDSVGRQSPEALDAAKGMLDRIPALFRSSLQTTPGARAGAYAALLDPRDDVRRRQMGLLGEEAPSAEIAYAHLLSAGEELRLPVLGLAVSALRGMSSAEKEVFFQRVHALIVEDNRLTPFEMLADVFLRRALDEAPGAPGSGPGSVRAAFGKVVTALSFLAHAGNPGRPQAASEAFLRGAERLGPGLRAAIMPIVEIDPDSLRESLDVLATSDSDVRRRMMDAAEACVLADEKITVEEWEVLRVLGGALDCPLPPAFGFPASAENAL